MTDLRARKIYHTPKRNLSYIFLSFCLTFENSEVVDVEMVTQDRLSS